MARFTFRLDLAGEDERALEPIHPVRVLCAELEGSREPRAAIEITAIAAPRVPLAGSGA
jgi:hypothetical protein